MLDSKNAITVHKYRYGGGIAGISFDSQLLPFVEVIEDNVGSISILEHFNNNPGYFVSNVTLIPIKIPKNKIREVMALFMQHYKDSDILGVHIKENHIIVQVESESLKSQIPKSINGIDLVVEVV